MEYKHFKKFNSPIMSYIKSRYAEMKDDFFKNIATSSICGDKPWYLLGDNSTISLYNGQIKSAAMKISNIAIDDDERRIMKWNPSEMYRYYYRRSEVTIDLENDWKVYNYTGGNWLDSPWAEMVDIFDSHLEQMFFNIAYPGAIITPHRGIDNNYFRVHICLQNNSGFIFNINGETRKWQEGVDGSFAFDDYNLKHGVDYVDAGELQPRVVAILDVKKSAYPDMF